MMLSTSKAHRRGAGVLVSALAFALATGCEGNSSPNLSSSSHFIACVADSDCDNLSVGATCGAEGACVDEAGEVVKRPPLVDEEFESPELDLTSFEFETGQGIRNEEPQAYTARSENVSIEDGELVVTARAESYEGAEYTSGSLAVSEPFTFGRVEVELLAPIGNGAKPSVWMLPAEVGEHVETCDDPADVATCSTSEWPAWGTIVLLSGRAGGTIISGAEYATEGEEGQPLGRASEFAETEVLELGTEYQTIAIDWGPARIDWFLDEVPIHTVDLTSSGIYQPEGENPFHRGFHLKFALALGGTVEDPTPEGYPKEMRVRAVRVYSFE